MKYLISAFEPFGGAVENITQTILSALPNASGNAEIIKACLPVSFKRAPIVLREAINTYTPAIVIMLGQCPAGENIRLERFAINMMDSTRALFIHIPKTMNLDITIRGMATIIDCIKYISQRQNQS